MRNTECIWESDDLSPLAKFALKNYQGAASKIMAFDGMTLQVANAAEFKVITDDNEYIIFCCDLMDVDTGEKMECCTSSESVIRDIKDICELQSTIGEAVSFKIKSFQSKNNDGKYYRAVVQL